MMHAFPNMLVQGYLASFLKLINFLFGSTHTIVIHLQKLLSIIA
jgi:hypothetical protein